MPELFTVEDTAQSEIVFNICSPSKNDLYHWSACLCLSIGHLPPREPKPRNQAIAGQGGHLQRECVSPPGLTTSKDSRVAIRLDFCVVLPPPSRYDCCQPRAAPLILQPVVRARKLRRG